MPAGFTEQERERITGQLLEAGRRLFTSQGLRKTTLEELVTPAGIAKSSFYLFFDSKEALYLELLARQAPAVTGPVTAVLEEPGSARDILIAYLRRGVEAARSNTLYRRLLTHPEELATVVARVGRAGEDELARINSFVLNPLLEFIRARQKTGELAAAEPMVIVGVIQAATLATLHPELLGEQYEAALDLTIRAVATGLTSEPLLGEGQREGSQ